MHFKRNKMILHSYGKTCIEELIMNGMIYWRKNNKNSVCRRSCVSFWIWKIDVKNAIKMRWNHYFCYSWWSWLMTWGISILVDQSRTGGQFSLQWEACARNVKLRVCAALSAWCSSGHRRPLLLSQICCLALFAMWCKLAALLVPGLCVVACCNNSIQAWKTGNLIIGTLQLI